MPPLGTHTSTRAHADTRIHAAGMHVPRAGVTGLLASKTEFPNPHDVQTYSREGRETGKKNKHAGVASSS